jgi:hypothetical protein
MEQSHGVPEVHPTGKRLLFQALPLLACCVNLVLQTVGVAVLRSDASAAQALSSVHSIYSFVLITMMMYNIRNGAYPDID